MYDQVAHPIHYNSHPSGVQCIEVARHMSFCQGNAFKYVYRFRWKAGGEDLRKALWYLDQGSISAGQGALVPLATILAGEPNSIVKTILTAIVAGENDVAIAGINELLYFYEDLREPQA